MNLSVYFLQWDEIITYIAYHEKHKEISKIYCKDVEEQFSHNKYVLFTIILWDVSNQMAKSASNPYNYVRNTVHKPYSIYKHILLATAGSVFFHSVLAQDSSFHLLPKA